MASRLTSALDSLKIKGRLSKHFTVYPCPCFHYNFASNVSSCWRLVVSPPHPEINWILLTIDI